MLTTKYFFKKIYSNLYVEQIFSFLDWIRKNNLKDRVIFVDLFLQGFFVSGGVFSLKKQGKIDFVLCKSKTVVDSFDKVNITPSSDWVTIFSSNVLEVWENKNIYDRDSLPIRFGLSNAEMYNVSLIVRDIFKFILIENRNIVDFKYIGDYPERFLLKANIDIAFWVDGQLRGCMFVEGESFLNAIKLAVVKTLLDFRYKPLSVADLDNLTVEVFIFSDLIVPITQKELKDNLIYPNKGYKFIIGNRFGLFIPTVFNCIFFDNLNSLVKHLVEKKTRTPITSINKGKLFLFDVFGFSYNMKSGDCLKLRGSNVSTGSSSAFDLKDIDQINKFITSSLDFVCNNQEEDGYVLPIISFFNKQTKSSDWVRLSLLGWSISLWDNIFLDEKYKKCANKIYIYIKNNLHKHTNVSNDIKCLTFIYQRKLAEHFGFVEDVKYLDSQILNLINIIEYEPILFSRVSLYLYDYFSYNRKYLDIANAFTDSVFDDFCKKNEQNKVVEFARYSDLVFLMKRRGLEKESSFVFDWFFGKRNIDGSYPASTFNFNPYTRGTGKVFESLSYLDGYRNRNEISSTIFWLMNMQYGDGNYYYLDLTGKNILGGFRHDYLNPDIWIDSTAHILVGLFNVYYDKIETVKKSVDS